MSETPECLDPLEDLRLALAVGASTQASIQHADTKAALLLTSLAGIVAMIADQPGATSSAPGSGVAATVSLVALGSTIATSAAVAIWHLGRCLAPRLGEPGGVPGNRFALPDLGTFRRPAAVTSVEQQRDEAWAAAATLADIAMQKFRAIQACLPWMAVTVASSITWLGLGLVLAAR
ncbi:hypothetical protein Dvina_02010 [Dactylosporangium vinaceum]|uniref:Pycsar effector protein domain-containing protein n=1 Tax=Dactylosporangium vinaceum TaxID=53362 RepID=A0ABV5MF35_9ACTN|nr:hypothetical protein [Dactylosporangium vinaceum]UAB97011.1 hypothetical protein Dvina_02010 [Dactylosporangium vinaceum]